MQELFDKSAFRCSKIVTKLYSTSFSLGIHMLDAKHHDSIYAIYGFVRYADEIVDTFHDKNRAELLSEFKQHTWRAIKEKISLNPILQSFQITVNSYHIDLELIEAFLYSMEMDLNKIDYENASYNKYIFGSAEVVGLMCLKVFCNGDQNQYQDLKPYAQSLGAAFQKVNFLRDIKSDYNERGRVYFPDVKFDKFNQEAKSQIEEDIKKDFSHALIGIKKLPNGSKLGVYVAYIYYLALFKKIKKLNPIEILENRIRVPNFNKMILLLRSYFIFKLKLI